MYYIIILYYIILYHIISYHIISYYIILYYIILYYIILYYIILYYIILYYIISYHIISYIILLTTAPYPTSTPAVTSENIHVHVCNRFLSSCCTSRSGLFFGFGLHSTHRFIFCWLNALREPSSSALPDCKSAYHRFVISWPNSLK